jgi:hypothetical protein
MGWVSVAGLAIAVLNGAQQPQAPRDEAARILVVAYSDGRTSEQLLRPNGGFWTPYFPRKADAPGRDGLALAALQLDFRAGADVRIRVSLKYGSPHQKTVPVAEAVIGAEPVRIAELEAYGVDPIEISVEAFSPAPLVQPIAASASPLLDVSADLVKSDVPIYRFTLRNRSNRSVMAVQYLMFRDGKQIGGGRRKTNRQTPVIAPAGEHTWTAPLGAGAARGFDRFEVSGILWEDGTVEGDPLLKASEDALAAGMARQLLRVLGLLSEAAPSGDAQGTRWSMAQLREAIERLPIDVSPDDPPLSRDLAPSSVKMGYQLAKTAVLEELSELAPGGRADDPSATRAWISAARGRYSAWIGRIGAK